MIDGLHPNVRSDGGGTPAAFRRPGGGCAAASFTLQTLQRTLASERSNEEVRSDLRYVR